MIALIIVISFMVIGLGALVHAIKNAPLIDEKDETVPNHNLD
jgi:hypothetical protein